MFWSRLRSCCLTQERHFTTGSACYCLMIAYSHTEIEPFYFYLTLHVCSVQAATRSAGSPAYTCRAAVRRSAPSPARPAPSLAPGSASIRAPASCPAGHPATGRYHQGGLDDPLDTMLFCNSVSCSFNSLLVQSVVRATINRCLNPRMELIIGTYRNFQQLIIAHRLVIVFSTPLQAAVQPALREAALLRPPLPQPLRREVPFQGLLPAVRQRGSQAPGEPRISSDLINL